MKKIKNILAFVLAAILLVSLCACGDDIPAATTDNQLSVTTSTEPTTASPAEDVTETPAPDPTESPAEGQPDTKSPETAEGSATPNETSEPTTTSESTPSNTGTTDSGTGNNTGGSDDDIEDLNKNGKPEDKRGAGSIGGSTTPPSTPTPKPSNPTTPSGKSAVDTDLVTMIDKRDNANMTIQEMPEKFLALEQEVLSHFDSDEIVVRLYSYTMYTYEQLREFTDAWYNKYWYQVSVYGEKWEKIEGDTYYPSLDDTVPLELYFLPGISREGAAWGEQVRFEKTEVERIVASLGINKKTTVKEAVTKINNYMCNNIKYDYDYVNRNDMYSALKHGLTRCNGYATLFQELCLYCGIDVGFISSKKINHAWNSVTFSDGTTLYVDVTWNDNDNGTPSNKYLLITKAEMDKDHPLD